MYREQYGEYAYWFKGAKGWYGAVIERLWRDDCHEAVMHDQVELTIV